MWVGAWLQSDPASPFVIAALSTCVGPASLKRTVDTMVPRDQQQVETSCQTSGGLSAKRNARTGSGEAAAELTSARWKIKSNNLGHGLILCQAEN